MNEHQTPAPSPLAVATGSPWPDYRENCPADRNETQHLVHIVEDDWEFVWPGWESIARKLNRDYGNQSTPEACRTKYNRLARSVILKAKQPNNKG